MIRNDRCKLTNFVSFLSPKEDKKNVERSLSSTYFDRDRLPFDFERDRDLESRFSERERERESPRESPRFNDLDLERSRRLEIDK